MKRFAAIITIMLIFALSISSGFASASISLNKTKAEPGDSVTISGTAQPGSSIIVKITDEEGSIVFFDAAATDASGGYSVVFVVPDDMTAAKLTVTAGSGADVATAIITVVHSEPTSSAEPTASPSSTSSAKPTASPSATSGAEPMASPSSTSGAGPTASSSPTNLPSAELTAAPSPTVNPSAVVIAPVTVKEDDKTGTVTIRINVSDLPDGTYAIELPDGTIVYVEDAVDGVLTIEAARSDIDSSGEIELTALGDDMVPLAGVRVQVSSVTEPGNGGASTALWWIVGVVVALAAVLLILILFIIKKKRQKNEI